jgi:hypothetical protein
MMMMLFFFKRRFHRFRRKRGWRIPEEILEGKDEE